FCLKFFFMRQWRWSGVFVNSCSLALVFFFKLHGLVRIFCFQILLQWVKEAWESLSINIIVRSFKRTGISNQMDGTEDEKLWYESDDDEDDELEFPG
ncbi:MAG: hypothetical protein AB2693_23085, partial [Candidatus Thiodiazotropha sp.]